MATEYPCIFVKLASESIWKLQILQDVFHPGESAGTYYEAFCFRFPDASMAMCLWF